VDDPEIEAVISLERYLIWSPPQNRQKKWVHFHRQQHWAVPLAQSFSKENEKPAFELSCC
jgi:hypothetical protein